MEDPIISFENVTKIYGKGEGSQTAADHVINLFCLLYNTIFQGIFAAIQCKSTCIFI